MTEQERATSVSVAEDVLKQLAAKTLTVLRGGFIVPSDQARAELKGLDGDTLLHSVLPTVRQHCTVCALGACFLSLLERGASSDLDLFDLRYSVFAEDLEPVTDAMGSVNAALIEAAFELGGGWSRSPDDQPEDAVAGVTDGEFREACEFGRAYLDDTARLKAIMENIIDHRGHFTPGERRLD